MEAWRQGELESMSLCHSVTTNICLFEHFVCERVGGGGERERHICTVRLGSWRKRDLVSY